MHRRETLLLPPKPRRKPFRCPLYRSESAAPLEMLWTWNRVLVKWLLGMQPTLVPTMLVASPFATLPLLSRIPLLSGPLTLKTAAVTLAWLVFMMLVTFMTLLGQIPRPMLPKLQFEKFRSLSMGVVLQLTVCVVVVALVWTPEVLGGSRLWMRLLCAKLPTPFRTVMTLL